jgi:outer membrane protein OmpA-like peptidoglycan-associated protein
VRSILRSYNSFDSLQIYISLCIGFYSQLLSLYYHCTKLRDKMKKYIQLFLCLAIMTTAGCGKKKNNMPQNNKPVAKKSQIKPGKKTTFDDNLAAFALDDDTLHNFAHDTKNTQENIDNATSKPNAIFQWQNAAVDQSKQDFKTIYFEFDKHKITKEQEANLQADIDHAKKMINLGKVIVVEGHACDSAGSAIYNMTLSEKRAKFIAHKLTEAGIDKANIKIAARGQEMPVHKGGNRHEQAVNRRVEVYAIDSK